MTYPHSAGYTENTTSRDAARKIERSGTADRIRSKLQVYFRSGGEEGTDQIAESIGENWFSVRPRISELGNQGICEMTGGKATTVLGGTSGVWRGTPEFMRGERTFQKTRVRELHKTRKAPDFERV